MMKKMILTMIAMMFITTAFAEEESATAVNNLEAYELKINTKQLSRTLELNADQLDAVSHISQALSAELMNAAAYGKNERREMVDSAISNNLKLMHYILNDDQMRKYLILLNITITNRGLNK